MGRTALYDMDPKMLKEQARIGGYLLTLRDQETSRSSMARKLGVSCQTVANWEAGMNIGFNTLWRYAKHEKVSFSDFLFRIAGHLSAGRKKNAVR